MVAAAAPAKLLPSKSVIVIAPVRAAKSHAFSKLPMATYWSPPLNTLPMALPKVVAPWSLTTLREKLVKIGAQVVRHGRYVTFQLAEVAVPRELFRKIRSLIDDLRRRPLPA